MKSKGLLPLLIWAVPVLILMALMALAVDWWAQSSREHLPVLGEVPDFSLTASNGEQYTRADMNGRIHVVDFFFSSCPGACPIMHRNMMEVYDLIEGSDKIRILSISVDPERDSLAKMRAYADSLGVSTKQWFFVRGPIDTIIDICENGFMLPAVGLPMGHTTRFVLVDHLGRIRGYYDGMTRSEVQLMIGKLRYVAEEME